MIPLSMVVKTAEPIPARNDFLRPNLHLFKAVYMVKTCDIRNDPDFVPGEGTKPFWPKIIARAKLDFAKDLDNLREDPDEDTIDIRETSISHMDTVRVAVTFAGRRRPFVANLPPPLSWDGWPLGAPDENEG